MEEQIKNRELNKCPDKWHTRFKRYIGLWICDKNLEETGAKLMRVSTWKEK